MAKMSAGEPRSVPDPDGEAYDAMLQRKRAADLALEQGSSRRWAASPARMEAQDAMTATPMDARAMAYAPVLGPAAEAIRDIRQGRFLDAAGNGGLAIADGLLLSTGAGVLRASAQGVADNVGVRSAEAVRKQLRRRGVAGPGEEIHHVFPLNGIKRTAENWRNHPAFLKVLPQAKHRRQTGSWKGEPKYSFVEALVVGTPTWMKTLPTGLVGRAGGVLANPPQLADKRRLSAPYGERPLR